VNKHVQRALDDFDETLHHASEYRDYDLIIRNLVIRTMERGPDALREALSKYGEPIQLKPLEYLSSLKTLAQLIIRGRAIRSCCLLL
jgi:hypothetical protein